MKAHLRYLENLKALIERAQQESTAVELAAQAVALPA